MPAPHITLTQALSVQTSVRQTCALEQSAAAQSLATQVPPAQLLPAVHLTSQPPQCSLSSATCEQPVAHESNPASASQLGLEQRPETQLDESQSAAVAQMRPTAHLTAQVPPQSTSLSPGPATPSAQLAARHTPAWQAEPLGHATPSQATSRQAPFTHKKPEGQLSVPQFRSTQAPA